MNKQVPDKSNTIKETKINIKVNQNKVNTKVAIETEIVKNNKIETNYQNNLSTLVTNSLFGLMIFVCLFVLILWYCYFDSEFYVVSYYLDFIIFIYTTYIQKYHKIKLFFFNLDQYYLCWTSHIVFLCDDNLVNILRKHPILILDNI